MYKVGDTVMLVKILDSEERGTLTDKVPLKTKGVVSHVFKDSVGVDGHIWYFDEIKLVVRGGVLKKPKKVVKNNDYETYTGKTGYYNKSYFNDGFNSW